MRSVNYINNLQKIDIFPLLELKLDDLTTAYFRNSCRQIRQILTRGLVPEDSQRHNPKICSDLQQALFAEPYNRRVIGNCVANGQFSLAHHPNNLDRCAHFANRTRSQSNHKSPKYTSVPRKIEVVQNRQDCHSNRRTDCSILWCQQNGTTAKQPRFRALL